MAIGNLNTPIRFREAIWPGAPIAHYARLAGHYGERLSEKAINLEMGFIFVTAAALLIEGALTVGAMMLAKENPMLGLLAYGAGKAGIAEAVTILDQ